MKTTETKWTGYLVELKSLWGLALVALCLLNIGSAGCVRRPAEVVILPCPTPSEKTIKSLRDDDVPDPILEYLISLDMYCNAVDIIRE
jgi:hypothetical protein